MHNFAIMEETECIGPVVISLPDSVELIINHNKTGHNKTGRFIIVHTFDPKCYSNSRLPISDKSLNSYIFNTA